MGLRRFFAASAIAMCFGMGAFVQPASAAPASDTFFNAPSFDISGTRGMAMVDLTGGTRQAGEPMVAGSPTAGTMWWKYVPAADGWAKFSACTPIGLNPLPQMSLGVYTGSRVDLLTTVAQGTGNCPAGHENAQVGPFAVTAGTYYWLQIGGADSLPLGETDAAITLDFNPVSPPPNDDWASAYAISGVLPQTFAANNGLATVETAEPNSSWGFQRNTLWYRWTATANGVVSINNCASPVEMGMDSMITVFTGSAPASFADLTQVGENDNGCIGAASDLSRLYVTVTSGTDYWIKLSNYSLDWGFPYMLEVKWVTKPENGLLPVIDLPQTRVGQTATGYNGTWGGDPAMTYTRQWLRCDAAGANCVDIAGATGSTYTTVAGDKGSTLRLRVTATNSNGSTTADSDPTAKIDDIPTNDLWANRTDLGTGVTATVNDDNNWATTEAGEPMIKSITARNTVWYEWTPSVSGDYVINNCLGGGVTDQLALMIGIRTGTTSLGTTVSAGEASGGCGPYHPNRTAMLFNATAGTQYSIQVASKYNLSTGPFTLSIAPVGDPTVTVPPSISGNPAPGSQLTLDRGDWITPVVIVPEIHWYRCDAGDTNCVDTGQTGVLYDLTVADAGKQLKATVKLANPYGTVTSTAFSATIIQDSDGDGVIDANDACPSEPGNKPNGCLPSDIVGTDAPTITGSPIVGQMLTSSTGSWAVLHDPIGYILDYQWQRCSGVTPDTCADIAGASSNSYAVAPADLAARLRAVVTASNADDPAEVQATSISDVVTAPPAAPTNTSAPSVSGSAIAGGTLLSTAGTWTPAGTTQTYAWLRCNDAASVASCSAIGGATASSYTLGAADLGKYMRSRVTATNVSGSATAESAPTTIVMGDSDGDGVPDVSDACPSEPGDGRPSGCQPSVVTGSGAPEVLGSMLVGSSLTTSRGSWTVEHDPLPLTYAYQWQRCDDATAGSCSDIGGATSDLYVLQAADYGKRVRAAVTASNAESSATQYSEISAVIEQMPGNLSVPVVSGTVAVGATLSTTDGSWTPADTTFTYTWMRCTDASLGSCSVIAGANAASYTIVAADDGKYLRSRVTGTTSAGTDDAYSAPTATVTTDTDGDGVADGADSCPTEPGLRANGCPSSVITGNGVPTVTGNLLVGQSLSSSTGSWTTTGDPIGYTLTYQWQRCDDATVGSCSDIAAATSSSYTLTAGDYGKRLRVIVTASNADDNKSQASAITAAVGQAPVNGVAPSVTGTAKVGQSLTADQGTWTPADATLTNQWLRCDDNASSGSCSVIAGQTGTTYTLVAADNDKYIRLRVTATTAAGSSSVDSAPSAKVFTDTDGDGVADGADSCPTEPGLRANGCPPSVITGNGVPTVTGNLLVGQSLSSSTGSWTTTGDPIGYTLTYQWQRCNDATVGSCSDIAAATSSSYTLTAGDETKRVRITVTATNADGTANQSSAISGLISQPGSNPVNNTLPTISGTPQEGEALHASALPADWTPNDSTLALAWLRCSDEASVGSCTVIPSADTADYTLTAVDVGSYMRVRVTATANILSTTVESDATAIVVAAPIQPTDPTGTTPPPPPPPPPAPPANPAQISGPARLKKVSASARTRKVSFRQIGINCGAEAAGSCVGRAKLTMKVGRKTVSIGSVKLSVRPGSSAKLVIKLSTRAKKTLRKRSLKYRLRITLRAPGFELVTYTGSGTISKLWTSARGSTCESRTIFGCNYMREG